MIGRRARSRSTPVRSPQAASSLTDSKAAPGNLVDLVAADGGLSAGLGGNDITGGAGADIIEGGPGHDTIRAGGGIDMVSAGLGSDLYTSLRRNWWRASSSTGYPKHSPPTTWSGNGTVDLTNVTVLNIDDVRRSGGATLIISDAMASTADFNGDFVPDLHIGIGGNVDASAVTSAMLDIDIDVVGNFTFIGGAANDTFHNVSGVATVVGGLWQRYVHCHLRRIWGGGVLINGTLETATIDTLRLDNAGTFNLSARPITDIYFVV